ncbi:helix-turn-helix domain-containing protein [Flavobacterium quisquiliarum]|uniref:Helix-turn-helix domain-containing protein n=1 Tax=Flavobacterium quisquiliarum TaxID=1834436 RepID=A0ABV8W793_9FLAO|nr:response regulator transcription factor [Flavobacterium quisquiliarum]MBW1654211.1 helix-turn-helix domain-containing protein [Flavobacterium quisquiliarum]NWL00796.1 AraC family transcriptional regulator [Flavobacterium collinsii]
MANKQPHRIKSISEFHEFRDLPKPEHPLVSVYNFEHIKYLNEEEPKSLILDFYSIALKRNANAKMRYGQQEYDFKEGVLLFIAPGQVFSIEGNAELQHTGYSLLIHPDFLWNTPLAQKIKQYEYFGYVVHEALHLSDKEEKMIIDIMKNIQHEYQSNIDKFSQDVIIAQIDLLLTYSERFYNRQFITRKINNHEILAHLEKLLEDFFNTKSLTRKGLPTVNYIAENLNVSPNYLSGLLKHLTGQSTQQHIHNKLIEKAKEKLSTTNLSISEIAFELGFEHQQSFSKLFKTKTNSSPLEFRQSFN